MALSFSLAGTLPREGAEDNQFDYDAYWVQSLTMAVAGRSLAQLVKSRYFDEAFMCGLLSHIGQLVMAECMTDEYAKVLDRVAGGMPSADEERQVLGFDHNEIGAALLRSWTCGADLRVDPARGRSVRAAGHEQHRRDRARMGSCTLSKLATTVICSSRKGPALSRLHELVQERFSIPDSRDRCVHHRPRERRE